MRKNRMYTLLIFIGVGLAMLGIAYFALHFPSWMVINLFLPKVTQSDLTEEPHKDFSGMKAGEDIPRLRGMNQYDKGVYTGTDFVTVETSAVISMDAYRLKNPADIGRTDQYLRSSRAFVGTPLTEYTSNPARRGYLYGRYYLLGLSDGSYVAAYADQAYGILAQMGQETTFPMGRLRMASTQEKIWLEEIADQYTINTGKVLYMINDNKISDFNFLDLLIRAVAVVIVIAAAFVILFFGLKSKWKG